MKIIKYQPTGEKIHFSLKSLVKSVFRVLYTVIQLFIIQLTIIFPKKKRTTKYIVSLCLIFKNEGKYLKEWITYHRLIGVDHFYLYNNCSTDNYHEELDSFIKDGFITLIDWPYQYAQIQAYEDAYNKFKDESKWIGFIDADEFINLKECNSIKSFLDSFEHYPSIYLNWRMFGTSGKIESHEDELVTEVYTSCWENLCNLGKTIINTDYKIHRFVSPHFATLKVFGLPCFPFNVNKIPSIYFKSLYNGNIDNKAYINHYWSKSYNEYYYKDFIKGDVASESNIQKKLVNGRFEYHELKNTTKDFSIQRWLVFLKMNIN